MPRKIKISNLPGFQLGNLIAQERFSRGLTQVELANLAGVTYNWLRHAERSELKNPGFINVCKIFHVLELDPIEVLKYAKKI